MPVSNTVKAKTYTGAQIILKTLYNLGIDTVFGYPGSAVLNLYDALYNQREIKHYLVRHEQAAVHAAEGYARVSGKCGVVFVTSGAGAANTVSGIANAYSDGYPLVVITGQVSKNLKDTGAFQEIDILDITKSCTKSGYSVTSIETLQSTLKDAYYCATSGKRGPVVVDISKDVFEESASIEVGLDYSETLPQISGDVLAKILDEIKNSKNPVIVAGGGVVHSNAYKELRKVVELLDIPVVNTMMGIGCISYDDKHYAGMIGAFGSEHANDIIRKSDLILSLGARFNDKVRSCFKAEKFSGKFIQIDINKNEISRVIPAYMSIVADIKVFLDGLIKVIKDSDYIGLHNNFKDAVSIINEENIVLPSEKISSENIIKELYNATKNIEPVITTEVGQHQIFTVKNYKFSNPHQLITSGGMGTMGFGLPAAIGVCIAENKRPVICIAGDGSFQMNEQELATIKEYNLPVKIFIMNNGSLGMIRQLQHYSCGDRYSQTEILNPDFVKLAEAYGIQSCRVTDGRSIKTAIEKAFSENSPYLIDFVINTFETI